MTKSWSLWDLIDRNNLLNYSETIALLSAVICTVFAVVIWRSLLARSIVRTTVLNYFEDFPEEIILAFKENNLRESVETAFASGGAKQHLLPSKRLEPPAPKEDFKDDMNTLHNAVLKKIARNLNILNGFGGPVYPSYDLLELEMIDFHYILEKLKEPKFAGAVADTITAKMQSDKSLLRCNVYLPDFALSSSRLMRRLRHHGRHEVYFTRSTCCVVAC